MNIKVSLYYNFFLSNLIKNRWLKEKIIRKVEIIILRNFLGFKRIEVI